MRRGSFHSMGVSTSHRRFASGWVTRVDAGTETVSWWKRRTSTGGRAPTGATAMGTQRARRYDSLSDSDCATPTRARVPGARRGPTDLDATLDGRVSAHTRRRLRHLRVRVPRSKLCPRAHAAYRPVGRPSRCPLGSCPTRRVDNRRGQGETIKTNRLLGLAGAFVVMCRASVTDDAPPRDGPPRRPNADATRL